MGKEGSAWSLALNLTNAGNLFLPPARAAGRAYKLNERLNKLFGL
jgi:hypothetical protein